MYILDLRGCDNVMYILQPYTASPQPFQPPLRIKSFMRPNCRENGVGVMWMGTSPKGPCRYMVYT